MIFEIKQIITATMNTSYRGSGDAPAILNWLKQFPYPHCKSANTLAALRSGVAIAEILTDKLPQAYHPLFLPNIEIYNLNPQRSMLNLKVMLDTLKVYCGQNQDLRSCLEDFTPQGLYFDHNMMEAFIFTVVMPLEKVESQNQHKSKEGGQLFQQTSDIANLSSIIVPQTEKVNDIIVRKKTQKREQIDREEVRIEKICAWLREAHHINVQQLQPQEIIGQLVNSAFTGSRLDNLKVVKQSHYQQGSVAVFKKVADYLLNCERMPKPNVLAMLEQIQTGCIREELFWNLVEDIMNIKASHLRKLSAQSRKKSLQKKKHTETSDKQNEKINQKGAIKRDQLVQKPVIQSYQCSQEVLKLAEQWIRYELGYDYSLKKAKEIVCIEQNPLLNGVLLGSIIMRMQLGKVNLNKEPKSRKEVDKNMNQVINCIIRRGIDAARKFSKFKPTYSTYLGIIWEVKQELAKKTLLEKNKRAEQARQRKEQTKLLAPAEKDQIIAWLKTRGYEIEELSIVPPSLVSEVCGQILQLRLLRQTTKKIQHSNLAKILSEIRRLGWQGEGESADILNQQANQLRWGILKFAFQLVKFKVYYYK